MYIPCPVTETQWKPLPEINKISQHCRLQNEAWTLSADYLPHIVCIHWTPEHLKNFAKVIRPVEESRCQTRRGSKSGHHLGLLISWVVAKKIIIIRVCGEIKVKTCSISENHDDASRPLKYLRRTGFDRSRSNHGRKNASHRSPERWRHVLEFLSTPRCQSALLINRRLCWFRFESKIVSFSESHVFAIGVPTT